MSIIKRTADNSYVIEKNGMPYHVPNEGEFAEEWAEINAYAEEHPDEVILEEPYVPTEEEIAEAEKAQANRNACAFLLGARGRRRPAFEQNTRKICQKRKTNGKSRQKVVEFFTNIPYTGYNTAYPAGGPAVPPALFQPITEDFVCVDFPLRPRAAPSRSSRTSAATWGTAWRPTRRGCARWTWR